MCVVLVVTAVRACVCVCVPAAIQYASKHPGSVMFLFGVSEIFTLPLQLYVFSTYIKMKRCV